MKPTNSETTGFLSLGSAVANSIGTQRGGTGAEQQSAGGQHVATVTPWRRQLQNSDGISKALKAGSEMFRREPKVTAEQLSSLKQLADEILYGPQPTPDTALTMATTLIGCFRAKDFADPKIFASALAATFQRYSEGAGRMVVDPLNGFPSKTKFAPAISEIREALDYQIHWATCLKNAVNRHERERHG